MNVLIAVVGGLAAVGFALFVWGLTLPRFHHAEIAADFDAAPEAVYAALLPEAQRAWRGDVRGWEDLEPREGRPVWRETDRRGNVLTLCRTADEPGRGFATTVVDNPVFGGTWEYRIEAAGKGSRLLIVENGEIYNPLFRAVFRLTTKPDATLRRVATLLADHLGRGTSNT